MNTELHRLYREHIEVDKAIHALKDGRGMITITDGDSAGSFQVNGLNDAEIATVNSNIKLSLLILSGHLMSQITDQLDIEISDCQTKVTINLKERADELAKEIESIEGSEIPESDESVAL